MRAYGARDHQVTVTGTEWLAPHFLRVWMTSPTLLHDVVVAPAAYVRFWMPDPDDPDVEHQRGYTLSEADPATGTFAVDFVLHEPAGPGSLWARRAEPGTTVQVTPLGSTRFDPRQSRRPATCWSATRPRSRRSTASCEPCPPRCRWSCMWRSIRRRIGSSRS
ncbi:siderophore-interacting protein [Nonomuraea rubra]|uniref:siderophore-interacting protein n=1 Tax=Nonomuraea rubra TaxID=46180 RepID=UPI003606706B